MSYCCHNYSSPLLSVMSDWVRLHFRMTMFRARTYQEPWLARDQAIVACHPQPLKRSKPSSTTTDDSYVLSGRFVVTQPLVLEMVEKSERLRVYHKSLARLRRTLPTLPKILQPLNSIPQTHVSKIFSCFSSSVFQLHLTHDHGRF